MTPLADASEGGVALVDGHLSSLAEAKIPLVDRGFLFAHAVFETLLVKNGSAVAWDAHYARLREGCLTAFLSVPEEAVLRCEVERVLRAYAELFLCDNDSCSAKRKNLAQLRIMVTGGSSVLFPVHRDPAGVLPASRVVIFCRPVEWSALREEIPSNFDSLSLKITPDLRAAGLVGLKSTSYLFSLMALESARAQGFDDVVFCNSDGQLTECSTSSFLWFRTPHVLCSAPFSGNCLPGVTLQSLVQKLSRPGIDFRFSALRKDELFAIKGCAVLSSVRGLVPVRQVDEVRFDIEEQKNFFQTLVELLNKK